MKAPVEIQVTEIRPSLSGRAVDRDRVSGIAESIQEIGLQTPITVRRAQRMQNGKPQDAYEIVAGQHRYEAMCRLEYDAIPCFVTDADDSHARLWEIDENLMRAELSPSERAAYTARRKAIYEELYPDTAHGVIGNGREKSRQVGDSTPNRFTADTATKTGKSERSVQRDATRGERIDSEVAARLRGTRFDTGSYLDSLAKLDPDQQRAKFEADQQQDMKPNSNAATEAQPHVSGVDEKRLQELKRLFGLLSDGSRQAFLQWVNGVV